MKGYINLETIFWSDHFEVLVSETKLFEKLADERIDDSSYRLNFDLDKKNKIHQNR